MCTNRKIKTKSGADFLKPFNGCYIILEHSPIFIPFWMIPKFEKFVLSLVNKNIILCESKSRLESNKKKAKISILSCFTNYSLTRVNNAKRLDDDIWGNLEFISR